MRGSIGWPFGGFCPSPRDAPSLIAGPPGSIGVGATLPIIAFLTAVAII
jgi:hypothetical protein